MSEKMPFFIQRARAPRSSSSDTPASTVRATMLLALAAAGLFVPRIATAQADAPTIVRNTPTDVTGAGLGGDLTVYRPSAGTWYVLQSSSNYSTFFSMTWGTSTDIPVQGDYDDDGKADIAVYRPSTGTWYVLQSSSNYTTYLSVAWGTGSDVPQPGDYDGDGKADLAVYRPSSGAWYILQSSTNYTTFLTFTMGGSGDIAVAADYDGDGRIDAAVYRPSTGVWSVFQSSTTTTVMSTWGSSTDLPLPADYDGDGKADIAVYRPASGAWWALRSGANNTTVFTFTWGVSTDVPLPGDYDGDGKADLAVYRASTGDWFILRSSSNYTTYLTANWGTSTDVALRPINKVPTPPGTAVIGFNRLVGNGSSFSASAESGFTVFSTTNPTAPNGWRVSTSFGHPAPFILFSIPGGTTVQNQVRITSHGSLFTFSAVDLYSSTTPVPYTFAGIRNSVTVFTVNGVVPNPMGAFATVTNTFATSAIDTLLITLANGPCCTSNPMGLDNIVLTR